MYHAKQLLNKKEVATLLNCSKSTVDRLEKAGLIPKRIRVGRNKVLWRWCELEAAIDAL